MSDRSTPLAFFPSAARLVVHPGAPLHGSFRPPGDKSITHRAYLLALLGEGGDIENPNPGSDCAATLRSARSLGLVERPSSPAPRPVASGPTSPRRLSAMGRRFQLAEPDVVLDCGNSGTSMRLLAGVLAAQPILAVLAGDASLHRRPVDRVIEPLSRMGASFQARGGNRYPPLVTRGAPLSGIDYTLPVASAQVASALLLAAIQAEGETRLTLPGRARDHTERMLAASGVPLVIEPLAGGGRRMSLSGPCRLAACRWQVPGDFSAAAFFLATAAASGATVTARDVGLNETRSALLDVLEAMGASVERTRTRVESGEPMGDVTLRGPQRLRAFDVPPEWVPMLIDEIPAWTIAAAAADGTSRVRGAAELRIKESDRLATLARGLVALGIEVGESPDGIEVRGGRVGAGEVMAANDHRIAMTFAMLGTLADGPVVVGEATGVETSFPGFAETFAALGGRIDAGQGG